MATLNVFSQQQYEYENLSSREIELKEINDKIELLKAEMKTAVESKDYSKAQKFSDDVKVLELTQEKILEELESIVH